MKNKLSILYNWFWKEGIINWFWKGIIGGIFKGITSSISESVSKTMVTIIPIATLVFIVLFVDKPIINKAIEFQENYAEQALNLSLEKRIIRSLTRVHFWSKVLYSSLSAEKTNEKQIVFEYENLKKSFKKWKYDFNKNLQFVQNNVSKDAISKRTCLGKEENISESGCQLKEINKKFQGMYKKLRSCYNSKKIKKSCNYTLSDFNQSFRTPIDNKIIQFYKTFQKEKRDNEEMI